MRTTVVCLLLAMAAPGAIPSPAAPKPEEGLKQHLTPRVKKFIERCLDDSEKAFVNAEAWLKDEGRAEGPRDRDQMWEILSGLVWNIDKPRARLLAAGVQNPERRRLILAIYDQFDRLDK